MSLEDFRAEMERCSNCLGCKWMPFDMLKSQRFGENCPSVCYYNFNTYSARGRYQLALALLTKDADYSDTAVNVIHNCMACGSCDISCKVARYNLEPLSHNLELKVSAVEKGKILPQHRPIMDNLAKEKTMIVGKTRATRPSWAKGLGLKELPKEKAEVLFFPGCKI